MGIVNRVQDRGIRIGARMKALLISSCMGALMAQANAAMPDEALAAGAAGEMDVYLLQFGSEFADGTRVLSHTQEALMGRSRYQDRSQVMLDFRNGAVTIEHGGGTNASVFANHTPAEVNYGFDYSTKSLLGDGGFFSFYNNTIRDQIASGMPLGVEGSWQINVPVSALRLYTLGGGTVPVTVTRSYATHNGQKVALLEFDIPAFEYNLSTGEPVVQWGKGLAVTDETFGTIHAIATHHRAMVMQPDGTMRPMSMKNTAYAKNADGTWRFDFSGFKEVEKAMERVAAGTEGYVYPVDFSGRDVEVNQVPFDVANSLQLLAFAAGEHSANGLAGDVYAYLNGQPSQYSGPLEDTGSYTLSLSNFTKEYLDRYGSVTSADQVQALAQSYVTEMEYRANMAYSSYINNGETFRALHSNAMSDVDWYGRQIEALQKEGKDYSHLLEGYEEAYDRMQMTESAYVRESAKLEKAKRELESAQEIIGAWDAQPTREVSKFAQTLEKIDSAIPDPLKKLGGATLDGLDKLGKANSIYTIGKAGVNATQDTSSGEISLTRSYSTRPEDSYTMSGDGSIVSGVFNETYYGLKDTGVDLLGIMASLYSGDMKGAALDGTALATSAASDIYVSGKGLMEINKLNNDLLVQTRELQAERDQKMREYWESEGKRKADEYVNDLIYSDEDPYANGYNLQDPRLDPVTGYPKTEAYWEYLKKNDPQKLVNLGIDPNMPVGGWPDDPVEFSSEPTQEDWDKFNRDIANAINDPGYPTAPPRDRTPPAKPVDEGPQYSEVPNWLQQQWAEMDERQARQEELNRIQMEILMERKHEEAVREEERKQWRADSGIDSMNTFFANNAFQYESMVGIVATDLSPWIEWLVTQDVQRLERLALQAGYPNLASALNDASTLIGYADDDGFRRWAMTAPSCAGLAGCGPQYLERWAMKRSQLALGDILAESRDIFSTAGLSDIKISGFLLSYIMRDYSLEDGDIVDVVISQFGREIFSQRISLLNAGTDFNVNLQPGVAAIEITAVNEGYSSPNTAQIELDNVTEGDNVQTYSLNTGETATLRVEPGQ